MHAEHFFYRYKRCSGVEKNLKRIQDLRFYLFLFFFVTYKFLYLILQNLVRRKLAVLRNKTYKICVSRITKRLTQLSITHCH